MGIRERLSDVRRSAQRRAAGAYGPDELGMALIGLAGVCTLISTRGGILWGCVGCALLVYALWRMLSSRHGARRRENDAVLRALNRPVSWVRRQRNKLLNRKTKAFVRCPNCHGEFVLPKGKGTLRATCPHCGEKSVHKV